MPPTIILHNLLEMQCGKGTVITKKFTYKMLYNRGGTLLYFP